MACCGSRLAGMFVPCIAERTPLSPPGYLLQYTRKGGRPAQRRVCMQYGYRDQLILPENLPLAGQRVMITGAGSWICRLNPAVDSFGLQQLSRLSGLQTRQLPWAIVAVPHNVQTFDADPFLLVLLLLVCNGTNRRLAPRQYASRLAERLVDAGARPVWVPSIVITSISRTSELEELDGALNSLDQFSHLAFTSSNGISAVMSRLAQIYGGRFCSSRSCMRPAVVPRPSRLCISCYTCRESETQGAVS